MSQERKKMVESLGPASGNARGAAGHVAEGQLAGAAVARARRVPGAIAEGLEPGSAILPSGDKLSPTAAAAIHSAIAERYGVAEAVATPRDVI